MASTQGNGWHLPESEVQDAILGQLEKRKWELTFIFAGKVGYLRASIGMVQENEVLSLLFEEKFWKSRSDNGLPYDFIENFEKMTIIIRKYCNAEIKISEGGKEKIV